MTQIQFAQYFVATQEIADMDKPDLSQEIQPDSEDGQSVPTPLPQPGDPLSPITEEDSQDYEAYFIQEEPDLRFATATAVKYALEDVDSERRTDADDANYFDYIITDQIPPPLENDFDYVQTTRDYHIRQANLRHGFKEDHYLDHEDPDEGVYIEIKEKAHCFVSGVGPIPEGHVVVIQVYPTVARLAEKKAVIERDTDNLTPEEIGKHREEINAAILKELQTWQKYKCFSRKDRRLASNIIDTRWVLKWKWEALPSGEKRRIIRARLTVRGFKDRDKGTLGTYAGTAQRYSQRVIVSEAVANGWDIYTSDVNKAFLQGVTYEELAQLTGEPVREVNFYLPNESVPCP